MFSDGSKQIVANQMHARIPCNMLVRDKWINLCIDVNSFIRECFSRNPVHSTPQVLPTQQSGAMGSQNPKDLSRITGAGSGDIAILHATKIETSNQIQLKSPNG